VFLRLKKKDWSLDWETFGWAERETWEENSQIRSTSKGGILMRTNKQDKNDGARRHFEKRGQIVFILRKKGKGVRNGQHLKARYGMRLQKRALWAGTIWGDKRGLGVHLFSLLMCKDSLLFGPEKYRLKAEGVGFDRTHSQKRQEKNRRDGGGKITWAKRPASGWRAFGGERNDPAFHNRGRVA